LQCAQHRRLEAAQRFSLWFINVIGVTLKNKNLAFEPVVIFIIDSPYKYFNFRNVLKLRFGWSLIATERFGFFLPPAQHEKYVLQVVALEFPDETLGTILGQKGPIPHQTNLREHHFLHEIKFA
jgi:hypothetical protein